MGSRAMLHAFPACPIKGEVPPCVCGVILPQQWSDTSPSMGEARRGWSLPLHSGIGRL